MAYIGFFLIMAGLAAAGGAIDTGTSMATAIAMTSVGAAIMQLFREEDEDGEEKEDSHASHGGSVDKPADESMGRSDAEGQGC